MPASAKMVKSVAATTLLQFHNINTHQHLFSNLIILAIEGNKVATGTEITTKALMLTSLVGQLHLFFHDCKTTGIHLCRKQVSISHHDRQAYIQDQMIQQLTIGHPPY